MRCEPGVPAPPMETQDFLGAPVSLSGLLGQPVMLSFYRYASCPVCNLRVQHLISEHAQLQSMGLAMVGVFQSPVESIREHVGRQDVPFPIVADPEMEFYRSYGVEARWGALLGMGVTKAALRAFRRGFLPGRVDGPFTRIPADFLIGPDGNIAASYYGRDINDHLPVEEVRGWLRSTTQNGAPR
jgi:peroxiredoxin Q/BCP